MPLDDDVGKQMAKETVAEKVPGQFFNVDSTLKVICLVFNNKFHFRLSLLILFLINYLVIYLLYYFEKIFIQF